jgi:hypothetical protein
MVPAFQAPQLAVINGGSPSTTAVFRSPPGPWKAIGVMPPTHEIIVLYPILAGEKRDRRTRAGAETCRRGPQPSSGGIEVRGDTLGE